MAFVGVRILWDSLALVVSKCDCVSVKDTLVFTGVVDGAGGCQGCGTV